MNKIKTGLIGLTALVAAGSLGSIVIETRKRDFDYNRDGIIDATRKTEITYGFNNKEKSRLIWDDLDNDGEWDLRTKRIFHYNTNGTIMEIYDLIDVGSDGTYNQYERRNF